MTQKWVPTLWYPEAISKHQNAKQPRLQRKVCVNEEEKNILNYVEILHCSPRETRLEE